MSGLRSDLADLEEQYLGSMLTDEVKSLLRDDVLRVVTPYLEGRKFDVEIRQDESSPAEVTIVVKFQDGISRRIFLELMGQ